MIAAFVSQQLQLGALSFPRQTDAAIAAAMPASAGNVPDTDTFSISATAKAALSGNKPRPLPKGLIQLALPNQPDSPVQGLQVEGFSDGRLTGLNFSFDLNPTKPSGNETSSPSGTSTPTKATLQILARDVPQLSAEPPEKTRALLDAQGAFLDVIGAMIDVHGEKNARLGGVVLDIDDIRKMAAVQGGEMIKKLCSLITMTLVVDQLYRRQPEDPSRPLKDATIYPKAYKAPLQTLPRNSPAEIIPGPALLSFSLVLREKAETTAVSTAA